MTNRPSVKTLLAGTERRLAAWRDDAVTVVRTHPSLPDPDELWALGEPVHVHDITEPWSA